MEKDLWMKWSGLTQNPKKISVCSGLMFVLTKSDPLALIFLWTMNSLLCILPKAILYFVITNKDLQNLTWPFISKLIQAINKFKVKISHEQRQALVPYLLILFVRD